MYKRFDQVRLKTTKNIKYLSAPPGSESTPDGIWSVAAIVEEELLLVKNSIIIRAPVSDVLKIAGYKHDMFQKLGKLTTYGKETDRKKDSNQS